MQCTSASTVKRGPRPTTLPNAVRSWTNSATGSTSLWGSMTLTISPASPWYASGLIGSGQVRTVISLLATNILVLIRSQSLRRPTTSGLVSSTSRCVPVAGRPVAILLAVVRTFFLRLCHSSSLAANATAEMKTSASASCQPAHNRKPARAKEASCRLPCAGQCLANNAQAATLATAWQRSSLLTLAGIPHFSHLNNSPLGCTEGGTSVCSPVDLSSTRQVPSGSVKRSESGASSVLYQQCDPGLPWRP